MQAEPSVAELLNEHRAIIDDLLAKISGVDHGNTCIVDELFVLRFVLSNAQRAEQNLFKTLEWRRKNKTALIDAQQGILPYEREVSNHVKRGFCGWVGDQYLILAVRAGHGHSAAMMREITISQCVQNMVLQYEHMYKYLDEKTRATGKLCKIIIVLDFQGFALRSFDRKFAKANGETSHWHGLLYPSIIKNVVLVNLPSTFQILYSFGKMFATRAVLDLQKLCPARTLNRSASECPYLSKLGSGGAAAVPRFLGGTFPTPSYLRLDNEMNEE